MVGGWHPAEQVDVIALRAVQVMPGAQAVGSAFTPKAEGDGMGAAIAQGNSTSPVGNLPCRVLTPAGADPNPRPQKQDCMRAEFSSDSRRNKNKLKKKVEKATSEEG